MMGPMNAEHVVALRDLDPKELGRRIKAARLAKGLTQTELAAGEMSVGLVSRLEAGQRRIQPATLDRFAERLGVSAMQLILGVAPDEYDEVRLEVDYAELALESGQPQEALDRSSRVVATASHQGPIGTLRTRARYLHALALEATGDLDGAVIELEGLVNDLEDSLLRVSTGIALSRCYRESGDLAHAVDTAERVLRSIDGGPLEASDEGVKLTATLAAAHIFRGDIGQAARVMRRAVENAEKLDSPVARAAAYWNASLVESERGHVPDAVMLAERALVLFRESQESRNLARLRIELGILLLQLDPPDIVGARENLYTASEEFNWASTSPVDAARNNAALAKAHLLAGEFDAAQEMAAQVAAEADTNYPITAAEARRTEGQACLHLGDRDGASRAYLQAVALLTGVGADRDAAQLWFELADLLEEIGEADAARAAYRSAAAATGLRSSARVRVMA